jgi:hypothetical protein
MKSGKVLVFAVLLLCHFSVIAIEYLPGADIGPKYKHNAGITADNQVDDQSGLEFLPGAGVGLKYTDNARLAADNQVNDLIAVGYLGFTLKKNDGPLLADITTSLNQVHYTRRTYDYRRYFNLAATASWEMIKQRFEWFLQDFYGQRLINYTDPNTPNNIQDSNIFAYGANINMPITARDLVTLRPEYRSFYYESQNTDNQRLSLTAKWNHLISPLTSIGLNTSARAIDYDDPAISDVAFANAFFSVSTERARTDVSVNIGRTWVKRDNGQSTDEFAGNLNWVLDLTARSWLRAYISSDLTDGGAVTYNSILDPGTGDPDDLQITTDIIRNKILTIEYSRQDGTLDSKLFGQLREVNYSETPNDARIKSLDARFNYPVSALLISGFYARYSQNEFIDTQIIDNNYMIGGRIRYQLSRNISSSFDLTYRERNSTEATRDYTVWSAFLTLVYGFGQPRPI